MEDEKRKTTRIEKVLVARYSSIGQGADSWDSTSIKNISIEGMLLFTNKTFAKGELINLLLKIPFDPLHWIEAKGQVVESLTNKTRIKFIELGEAQRKLIGDYVDWFTKKEKK